MHTMCTYAYSGTCLWRACSACCAPWPHHIYRYNWYIHLFTCVYIYIQYVHTGAVVFGAPAVFAMRPGTSGQGVLHCAAASFSMLQNVAACCSVLQYVAVGF